MKGQLTLAVVISASSVSLGAAEFVDPACDSNLRLRTVGTELVYPWGMDFLPGGDILVTERVGRLRRISEGSPGDGEKVISGSPSVSNLLDVALHPQFNENRVVVLSYLTAKGGPYTLQVAKARLENDHLADLAALFTAFPHVQSVHNRGGTLLFAPDGNLFVTTGDAGLRPEAAQDTRNHLGTIIRITDSGVAAPDNPFSAIAGSRPEIYTYGHRHVQGLAIDPFTGHIWAHEHGPIGGDELNLIRPGGNYGWPIVTDGELGGSFPDTVHGSAAAIMPIAHWSPAIAPSGMTVYQGDKFPLWEGDIFIGSLAKKHLRRLRVRGGRLVEQEMLLASLNERIRNVKVGPEGYLYVLTDNIRGRLIRLEPCEASN